MQNAIEEARENIKRLAQREIQLLADQDQKRIAASDAEAEAGAAYLAGTPGDHVDRTLRLQVEAKTIAMAIAACRQQRHEAVQRHLDARIADLRQRSAEARGQADSIKSKTAPLLAALKEIENAEYNPATTPESIRIGAHADLLHRQAAELERRGVPHHGNAEIDGATSIDALIDAVLTSASDSPSAAEVLMWHAAIDPHGQFASHERSYRLTWDNGVIDYAASHAQVAALRTPLPVVNSVGDAVRNHGRSQGMFYAPPSMQPAAKPKQQPAPVPDQTGPVIVPPPVDQEPSGQRLTVDQYLGAAARPKRTEKTA